MRVEAEGILDYMGAMVKSGGRLEDNGDEILGYVEDISEVLRRELIVKGKGEKNAVVIQNEDDEVKMVLKFKAVQRADGFYEIYVKKGGWRKF